MAAQKYTSVGRKLQIGDETTYGTLASAMDMNMYYDSESLDLTVLKEAEDNLLAATTDSDFTLKGNDVGGEISIKIKPENLGVLKYALNEASNPTLVVAGVYKHTLTLRGPNDVQPSFSAIVDRGPVVNSYTGLLVDSMTLEGSVREPITLKMTVKGYGLEGSGTIDDLLVDPSEKTFTAIDGAVSIKGTTISDVTKASVEISQNLDEGEPTYGSGLYHTKHQSGKKDVKTIVEAFYNDVTSPIREADYKGNTYISEIITWVSPAIIANVAAVDYPFKIAITTPKVSIQSGSSSNSGKETKKITLEGKATSNGGSSPLTVEVWDDIATKY